ncbi:Minus agglutinin [Rhodotorula toruloides ATCC 204091]|uniref:Minus agglutinin n=1 Tax=Rhodotorula toruloides TaxID=5286 RepID=A0A2T0A4M6_RHOTO|nr:Minus agglutinin [Rhodotorula toruloides ATCC 204091]PRQ72961.1 hypothetical protein AAT19DRAFT_15714 [Rhodotorula toruloides]
MNEGGKIRLMRGREKKRASPMSPDELEEESRMLEGLGAPRQRERKKEREDHHPPLNAFNIRRQNARRSSFPEEPGPMSPDKTAEERAMLGRVEKRKKRREEPETRRERKVRYRRERERGEGAEHKRREEPEDEDWRAAIEGEYSPSPDEGDSVPPRPEGQERKGREKRGRALEHASAQAKWITGVLNSEVYKPERPKSMKGKGERRRAVEPKSRWLKRVQEEDEGPEERGKGREGSHVESSPEESPAEDEHRPLNQHGHRHDGRRTPSPKPARKVSKRRKDRGWDEEKYGPAHLSRRPDQEKETKGWSWTAVKHDGSKQCVVAGCIVLAIAVLAVAGWAIWYFGTQYHKQGS